MKYAALQVKTSYSILNSLNSIKPLVSLAANYGYTSLAITDIDNMFGVMEFYNECNKLNIKPIIGLNISKFNILLYAKNGKGYNNLIKLSTIISGENLSIDTLKEYNDNLILVMPFSFYNEEIYNIYEDTYIGYTTKEEKDKIKEKKVFINDVSYLYKNDYKYLDYVKMIKLGKTLGEYELNKDINKHLYTYEELSSVLDEEDFKTYEEIINKCNLIIEHQKDLLPVYDKSVNSKEYLNKLANKGLAKRLNNNIPNIYQERLNYELEVIDKMGYNDYFLIVYDFILYAKKNNILIGPGRGSAAGSLVSYTLGITEIDPLKYNLLFERFLNIERVTMPDIDTDIDGLRRKEVIDYVINKYGSNYVAGIITFNTLASKQVLRDVSKILKLDQLLVDTIIKIISKEKKSSLKDIVKDNETIKKMILNNDKIKHLFDISIHLEGLPKSISNHPAGIVLSNKELINIVPLYKNDSMYITAYSKDFLEELGLLKMDFLPLLELSLISKIIDNIKKEENINITFNNIPIEDKETIKLFYDGLVDGIFQVSSSGMKETLKKLKPLTFIDIVDAISIYRPGAMDSINDYANRKNGKVKIEYLHEDLIPILKPTYGVIIYQEQIMEIAQKIAGYTLGESDILRRAISKKNESIMLNEKEKFITNSIKRGYSKDISEKIFDLILKFASYGFNKSHSVAYATVSCKMAFLKAHFYKYFIVELINKSIKDKEIVKDYLYELKKRNYNIITPSINKSRDVFYIENNNIICPLNIIDCGQIGLFQSILEEREKSEFTSFIDFIKRMNKYDLKVKTIKLLILSGLFDEFDYNRNTLLENLENILNYMSLYTEDSIIEEPAINICPELSKDELISHELEIYGFYLTNHPVTKYRTNEETTSRLENYVNKYIYLILEVNNIKEIVTKNNEVMAFISASDEYSLVDLTMFPKIYKLYNNLKKYDIIKIYGRVEKRFDKYQLVVSTIKKLN